MRLITYDKLKAVAFVALVSALCAIPAPLLRADAPHDLEVEIDALVGAEEFKAGEMRRLDALPVETIPMLMNRIRASASTSNTSRAMQFLSRKLEQFDPVVPVEQKRAAVALLVAECERSKGSILQQRLSAIRHLRDERIDELLSRVAASDDVEGRRAAEKLIRTRAEQR